MYVEGWRCTGPFSNILYCVVDWCGLYERTAPDGTLSRVWGSSVGTDKNWLDCVADVSVLVVHKIGRSQRSGRSCRLIIARRPEVGVRRRKWEIGNTSERGSTHFRCHFIWRGLMSRARSADFHCYNDTFAGLIVMRAVPSDSVDCAHDNCALSSVFKAFLMRFMGFLLIMTGQNGFRNALVHGTNIVSCDELHEVRSFGRSIDWLIGLWNFPNVLPTILLIEERWF